MNVDQPITCLIADDHEIVREGLRMALSREPNIRVVGEASDGEAAVVLAERRRPAVAPAAFMLHLQVEDAQAWWDRAVGAGCTIKSPIKVEFWGDIYGQLTDPYGVTWTIGQSVKK